MPSIVTTLDGLGNPTEHRVTEEPIDVTDAVNGARRNNDAFVLLTGEDGKQFTVRAEDVNDIKGA